MRRPVTLTVPDVVSVAGRRLLPSERKPRSAAPPRSPKETPFADRIAAAASVLIAGHPGAVVAPGGHAYALIGFRAGGGHITKIETTPCAPRTVSLAGAA
ncbi:hypothetical protein [Streptomyces carpinensis]|uniref:Uncharacterized protein n=1 Tax=Streptomyces carpinensis TaxID=66369 RepID=A0ABV1VUE2_9ACTN|nr:hypothetical protein [Streptomyces carpinensis]